MFICYTPVRSQPYPHSKLIKDVSWDDKVIKIFRGSGDNWPITWINDTLQVTSYGDGNGFEGQKRKFSLGMAYIIGDPPDVKGRDLGSNIDTPMGEGPSGIKTSGILYTGNRLFLFVRNYIPENSKDYTNSRLACSDDLGKTFTWASWYFSNTFGCPDFIQFGQGYKNARDQYVYIISQDNDNAYKYAPGIVLARVKVSKVSIRSAYTFYAGLGDNKKPLWSEDIQKRKEIFQSRDGVERISMTYNPGIERYLLVTSFNPGNSETTHTGALGIFESPEPWGPWRTVYYNPQWSGECRTYHQRFPAKWISRDGTELYLLFSGLDCGYYDFCFKKVKLKLY